MARQTLIIAGGSGTRLWPLSRADHPKQLLPLIGPERQTLLSLAADRAAALVSDDACRWICASDRFAAEIAAALPFRADRILGEPIGRDTLNAIAFSAAVIARSDPQAVLAILTADHLIEPVDRFVAGLQSGFALVEDDPRRLITFTIAPTRPVADYGYIEYEPSQPAAGRPVRRYIEKPPVEMARRLIDAGNVGWSSGMFIFAAQTILSAVERYAPENHRLISRIADAWETPDRTRVLAEVYPTLPKTSIDYAVMQPASQDGAFPLLAVPLQIKWLDVGSLPALASTLTPDAAGNRSNTETALRQCADLVILSSEPDHLVAAIGCSGLAIVRTADATLICPIERIGELKAFVEGEVPPERR